LYWWWQQYAAALRFVGDATRFCCFGDEVNRDCDCGGGSRCYISSGSSNGSGDSGAARSSTRAFASY
jgi:hypothetical protein